MNQEMFNRMLKKAEYILDKIKKDHPEKKEEILAAQEIVDLLKIEIKQANKI